MKTGSGVPEGLAREVLEASINPILVTDATAPDNPIIYVNPAFEQVTGYTRDDALGRNSRFLHGDDVDQPGLQEIRKAVREERPVRAVVRNYRKDGTLFWNELFISPLRHDGGAVTHYIGIQSDITDRQQAETLSARLGRVVDESANEVFVFDAGTLLFVQVNRGAQDNLGYTAEELHAMTPLDLKPEFTRDTFEALLAPLRSGQQEQITFETVHKRKDATTYDVEVRLQLMHAESPPVFVAIIQDITERKRAEQTLHDSEARLRAMIDTAIDGIIIIDRKGTVQLYNAACERLFGYAADEVLGQNVRMLMPSPYHEQHDGYIRSYFETGVRRIIGIGREVFGRRKDGSIFPLDLSVGETSQGGHPIFVGMLRDLTERKRAEESLRQAQKMEAVGQLTGGIAHDFNNLLTVIQGNLEMLEPRLQQEEHLEILRDAQEAAELGGQLTDRLLAFARRQPLEPRPIDLNDMAVGMSELLHRSLGENIQVSTVLAGGLWPTMADPGQVENALLNLAINARDAMPTGGSLTVETANIALDDENAAQQMELAPGHYVKLSVSDNGHGMTEEVRARAVEPFFTTKEAGSGTGMGLSMIYGFAKQSGGHLQLDSELGRGTTVSLYLPRLLEDSGLPDRKASSAARSSQGRGETILVVEDDPRVRRVTLGRLRGLGYEVLEAKNGETALEILEGGPAVDLLFTDLVMPGGMTGGELAQKVRQKHPDLKILFTSGYAGQALLNSGGLEADAAMLRKPYKTADLARRLRSIFEP